jgi:MFS family permease
LGGIPGGILYDRRGGRTIFSLSAAGIALGIALCALVTHPAWLILCALLHGLAQSIFFVSIFPFLTEQSSVVERSHVYSVNGIIWTGFRILGSLLAGYLPLLVAAATSVKSSTVTQRMSLLLGAVLVAASVPLLISISPSTHSSRNVSQDADPGRKGRHDGKAIVRGGLVILLMGLAIGLTTPFYNLYFRRVFGASQEQVGILLSISQIAVMASTLVGPAIVRRRGLAGGAMYAKLLAAPIIGFLGLPLPLGVAAPTFLLATGFSSLAAPLLQNLIMTSVQPSERGAMSGIRVMVSYGGQAIAGLLGGWLVTSLGYGGLFAAASVSNIALAATLRLLYRGRELIEGSKKTGPTSTAAQPDPGRQSASPIEAKTEAFVSRSTSTEGAP